MDAIVGNVGNPQIVIARRVACINGVEFGAAVVRRAQSLIALCGIERSGRGDESDARLRQRLAGFEGDAARRLLGPLAHDVGAAVQEVGTGPGRRGPPCPEAPRRRIDRFLDLESVRSELRAFYSSIGRPSIDPALMIRMLIVGYCMGIRSERRLCEEVHLNLAYRWFCRLGLDGKVPDHSTFSRNRHGRFRQSDILRHLFEDGGRALPARRSGGW